MELWSLLSSLIIQGFGLVIAGFAAAFLLFLILRQHFSLRNTLTLGAFFIGIMVFFWFPVGIPNDLQYPFGITTYGPAEGPALPLSSIFSFFRHLGSYERVKDIARL